jgi:hypothetical protein
MPNILKRRKERTSFNSLSWLIVEPKFKSMILELLKSSLFLPPIMMYKLCEGEGGKMCGLIY